ncbi:Bifunctional inhibitor/lipid-transfer protein/seed storage 2S albumin superfamily protein, partial [Prunus dulcis]
RGLCSLFAIEAKACGQGIPLKSHFLQVHVCLSKSTTNVYTIMNRADPASKRLAPRQPRLLPCRRKTHFRGHVSPPQRLAQSPTLELCAKLPLSPPYK